MNVIPGRGVCVNVKSALVGDTAPGLFVRIPFEAGCNIIKRHSEQLGTAALDRERCLNIFSDELHIFPNRRKTGMLRYPKIPSFSYSFYRQNPLSNK